MFQIDTNKFEIDFVLYVTHHDKGRNNASTLTCGHCRTDLAVPYVVCAAQERSHGVGGHGEEDCIVLVGNWDTGTDPIGLGGIAEVLSVGSYVV